MSKTFKKGLLYLTLSLIGVIVSAGLCLTTKNAHASGIDAPDYLRKAYSINLYKCYAHSGLQSPVVIDEQWSYEKIIDETYANIEYPMPNGYGGNTTTLNCSALLFGDSAKNFNGLLYLSGIYTPSSTDSILSKAEFLTKMGYEKTNSATSESGKRCLRAQLEYTDLTKLTGSVPTISEEDICFDVDNDGVITKTYAATSQTYDFKKDSTDGHPANMFVEARDGALDFKITCAYGSPACWNTSFSVNFGKNKVWNEIISLKDINIIGYNFNSGTGEFGGDDDSDAVCVQAENNPTMGKVVCLEMYKNLTFTEVQAQNANTSGDNYAFKNNKDRSAFNVANRNILSLNTWEFSPRETASMYLNDLKEYATLYCEADDSIASTHGFTKKVKVVRNGAVEECYYKPKTRAEVSSAYQVFMDGDVAKINGINSNNIFGKKDMSLDDVANELNRLLSMAGLDLSNMPQIDGAVVTGDSIVDSVAAESSSNSIESACYSKGGAGGMSWFICPALGNLTGTASGMEKVIQTMMNSTLSVSTDYYAMRSSSGTPTATYVIWQRIRDVANVLMVIVLLVIVTSQLTGYGIDNYGIKKMLPKLIVMAIMINLSYIICELAIDLSNIFGNGLSDMFIGLSGLSPENYTNLGSGFFEGLIGAMLGVGGAAAGGSGLAIAAIGIFELPVIAIVILVMILVVFCALVVMFAMLGVRMMIVIGCIVLAPIAFASYVLPNTSFFYKKWWQAFKAAIIIYPICSLVLGISHVIKVIVNNQSNNNALTLPLALVALAGTYLPFFVLPGLLRGAISAVGRLGGAMSALGNTLRRGAQSSFNVAKNTELGKSIMTQRQQATANYRAKNLVDSLRRKERENGELSERDKARLSRAQSIMLADKNRKEREARGATEEFYKQGEKNQQLAFLNERDKMYFDNYSDEKDYGKIQSALDAAMLGDDAGQASGLMRAMMMKDKGMAMDSIMNANWDGMSTETQDRLLKVMGASDIAAFQGYAKYRSEKNGGKRSFKDWVTGGNDTSVEKAKSFADFMQTKGINAMTGYSKDEVDFVKNNFSSIASAMGEDGERELTSMAFRAALYSNDADIQRKANAIVSDHLQDAGGVAGLDVTADEISSRMSKETMDAVVESYVKADTAGGTDEEKRARATSKVRSGWSDKINSIENSERARTKMGGAVAKTLGIGGSDYSGKSMQEMVAQFQTEFAAGDGDAAGRTMNAVVKRYGSDGATGVANVLSSARGIDSNINYQNSLAGLQRALNSNQATASTMYGSNIDAYQMISNAGRTGTHSYTEADGTVVDVAPAYGDLSNFAYDGQSLLNTVDGIANSSIDTIMRYASSKTLDGSGYVMTDAALEQALQSPLVQNDVAKTELLQATLQARRDGTIATGATYDVKAKALEYRNAQAASAQASEIERALHKHAHDVHASVKQKFDVPTSGGNSRKIVGYPAPAEFARAEVKAKQIPGTTSYLDYAVVTFPDGVTRGWNYTDGEPFVGTEPSIDSSTGRTVI